MSQVSGGFIKEGKPHGEMSISYWESHGAMEQAPSGRKERLKENDRRNRGSSKERSLIVERLGTSSYSGIEALKIPRCFTIGIQPRCEVIQNVRNFADPSTGYVCCVHLSLFVASLVFSAVRN